MEICSLLVDHREGGRWLEIICLIFLEILMIFLVGLIRLVVRWVAAFPGLSKLSLL